MVICFKPAQPTGKKNIEKNYPGGSKLKYKMKIQLIKNILSFSSPLSSSGTL